MSEKWRQLQFVMDDVPLETSEGTLHDRIIETRAHFRELARARVVSVTDARVTAKMYVWQDVDYRPGRRDDFYDMARGYLMVEPDDIPRAARIVDRVYRRNTATYNGEFKWLMMKTVPPGPDEDLWALARDEQNYGTYANLDPIDPRVVLYEYSPEMIKQILEGIAGTAEWRMIEARRRAAFPHTTPPIRGSDIFTDHSGSPWYSLSYNALLGHHQK